MGTSPKIQLARRKTLEGTASRVVPIRLHLEIQKRLRADEALRLAEHRYESIFEHALEGIFQTLEGGKIHRGKSGFGEDVWIRVLRRISRES